MDGYRCRGGALVLITIAGSILGGCAGSPEAAGEVGVYAPALVEPAWLPQAAEVEPETARSLTLEQALRFADAHSPVILSGQARVGVTEGDRVDAVVGLPGNPQLSVAAGARQVGGRAGLDWELGLQQQLEVAGEPGLRRQWADQQREVARASLQETRWAVHVEVHRLFASLLLLREQRAQAERFVTFSASLRDLARRKVQAGESSPLTLLVAETDLAQSQEALLEIQRRERSLRAQMVAAMGWPSLDLPPLQGELPEVRSAPEPEALLEVMARHHPSLRTRELAVQAAQARLALEERQAWPKPSLGVSVGQEADPGGGQGASLWMLQVGVPLPLWRRNQGARQRAHAQVLLQDRERLSQATLLQSLLLQALWSLQAAQGRVALYEEQVVPQLEANLEKLQRAYELGEVDLHRVSQTRGRLLEAMGRYLDARVTYYNEAASLEGLVGTEIWDIPREAP